MLDVEHFDVLREAVDFAGGDTVQQSCLADTVVPHNAVTVVSFKLKISRLEELLACIKFVQ